jgi:acetyl-CoA/propionyl-CoA carboxylase biotin carboxyl carrier protein
MSFDSALFDTVLVANRGEIAVRVIRTLRALGIRSIAVHSDADAGSRHVREADEAVRLGPAPARQSYLSAERILDAARLTGAQAVHPGYGFLAENAAFARACADAGVVFVGPPVHAVEVMGDKIRAKRTVAAAGVPVVPGRAEAGMTDADLLAAAAEIGFPVLVKPSAGGGGKGMRVAADAAALPAEIRAARREAAASFGDDTLFLERYVARPRHIEVQVLADSHGGVVHLGERECSLQRRHQKIVEEAPSVFLDGPTRARITAAAVDVARAVGYSGAGTVEFIVGADDPAAFFFLEMNTRLQVEHAVTEMVTGVDLVAEQIRVAAGRPLAVTQDDVRVTGHAVEARVYAEDPSAGFLPSGGTALLVREPAGEGVRVDSGLREGERIGTDYDPMLAKVVAWGPDRAAALARLDGALARTVILGVRTNIAFVRALLAHPDVVAGRLDTDLVGRDLAGLLAAGTAGTADTADLPADALAAYGMVGLLDAQPRGPVADLWDVPSGWRAGSPPAPLRFRVALQGGGSADVAVSGTPADATVSVEGDTPRPAAVRPGTVGTVGEVLVTVDGRTRRWWHVPDGAARWLGAGGAAWRFAEADPAARAGAATAGVAEVRSPMPGTVIAVHVAAGDEVTAGQALAVVEAMKMEHTVTAPRDGRVKDVPVRTGDRVALDQILAVVAPAEPAEPAEAAAEAAAADEARGKEPSDA